MANVLLIEDNNDVREMFATALRMAGWVVVEAADGHEGYRQAVAVLPDVVVTDVCMPGMDGFALLRELRAFLGSQQLPIIIVTGDAPSIERLALSDTDEELACCGLLIKPVCPDALVREVASALARCRRTCPPRGSAPSGVRLSGCGGGTKENE
jgi:CheY-like chemotaxis protein